MLHLEQRSTDKVRRKPMSKGFPGYLQREFVRRRSREAASIRLYSVPPFVPPRPMKQGTQACSSRTFSPNAQLLRYVGECRTTGQSVTRSAEPSSSDPPQNTEGPSIMDRGTFCLSEQPS